MKKYYQDFLLMVQLLTRIPVRKELPCRDENFRRGAYFFFVIGIIIGSLQYAFYRLLDGNIPDYSISILLILIDVFITGGFHIDGFGDSCDGFFAAKGRDKVLDIMKDSRIGTFAAIGIIINLLIKFEAYKFIAVNGEFSGILFFIPMISRAAMVFLCLIGRPAKEGGLGNLFINNVGIGQLLVNILGTAAMGFIAGIGLETLMFYLIAVSVVAWLFNKLCEDKIGGITGDSLGAINELVTLTLLLFITI
ncbi:adenosylcobinamide-GDP ribazoletransferase [Alloiococcus sp. CFN-8]|uniref:adenosylcobinamide-GDP ribazoletransferase n=1 Tax=Alloiococcus sp. CFN-8 TaxID=3416081 RepID=UPI003CF16CD5